MFRVSIFPHVLFFFLPILAEQIKSEKTQLIKFVGCFKENREVETTEFPYSSPKKAAGGSVLACTEECSSHFFRYAALQGGERCKCGSKYGLLASVDDSQCNKPCNANSSQICGGDFASSIYDTGHKVPGPPSNFQFFNISETSFRVSWDPPQAPNGKIKSYIVSAELLRTYSRNRLPSKMSWTHPADVKSTDILELHPGTGYNVTVEAESDEGIGKAASVYVETHIGYPEVPDEPEVLYQNTSNGQIIIKFHEGVSENGPISGYRIVVVCGLAEFDPELLDSFSKSVEKGLSYYITASLEPDAHKRNFTVGDNLLYGGYKNVPLHSNNSQCSEDDVQFVVGVVSSYEDRTCVSYSNLPSEESVKKIIISPDIKEEGLESGLISAIVVSSTLLALLVVAYFLARHFAPQRRGISRMEDPQEMCLQGPMIEVENYGYLPEEEEENRVNHYDRLKKALWDIPRNFLEIQSNNILGRGEFGTILKGTVLQNGYPTSTSVQCIEDGMLSLATKRRMLQELAVLIKCGTGKHSNVIHLIGTCESPEMLYVVLEYHPATLKDMLLESRTLERCGFQRDLSTVCSLPQQALLQIAVGIAQGMAHLANNKIIHKQLAACSVIMADGMIPKISNFGIAKSNRPSMVMDFTRWTAREVFRSQHFTSKSDVWAMGCLLWEIAALGGTIYNNISTSDVPSRVMRGLRPLHLSHMSDEFYQIMLQCWQLDLDERPDFSEIAALLCDLISSNETHLDWNVVPGFHYEQYISEYEAATQM